MSHHLELFLYSLIFQFSCSRPLQHVKWWSQSLALVDYIWRWTGAMKKSLDEIFEMHYSYFWDGSMTQTGLYIPWWLTTEVKLLSCWKFCTNQAEQAFLKTNFYQINFQLTLSRFQWCDFITDKNPHFTDEKIFRGEEKDSEWHKADPFYHIRLCIFCCKH